MRRNVGLGFVLVLAVAVAACGGDDGEKVEVGPTRESLAAAVDRTVAGEDMRMEFTQTVGAQGIKGEGSGEFDADENRASIRMDMELPEAGPQSMEMVVDQSVLYMKAAMFGGEWVRIDLDAIAPGMEDVLDASGSQDPTQFLNFLRGAGDFQEVGSEDVRGTATRHFTGSYTLRGAVDAMTEEQRKGFERMLEQVPDEMRDTPIPFDAWVDEEGRVRRFDMTMELPGAGTMDMSMEMFDFGSDVSVDVPDDAVDFSDMMSSFSS